jgi:hypothetical protein
MLFIQKLGASQLSMLYIHDSIYYEFLFYVNSYSDFLKYCSDKKYRTYISKPDVGCQGRGIFLTKNPSRDIKP